MLTTCYGSMLTIISFNILFYRLKMSDKESNKKSASEIIQIDTIVPKTPKVHRDTNQETRKAAVQLNIVEVDENVTSEIGCWEILEFIGHLIMLLWILLGCISLLFGFLLVTCCILYFWIWKASNVFCYIGAFCWLAMCGELLYYALEAAGCCKKQQKIPTKKLVLGVRNI